MTPRPPDAGPAVVFADASCAGVLSQVIADAFLDLAVSRWLIPYPAARRRIFPGYFRLYVEHALADGLVCTTPDQDAVALWLPAGDEAAPPPEDYDERLAAVTGPWIDRFRLFDQTLEDRHPTGYAHRRVAPVHCCTGAPSGPCMRVVLAHGPSKPLGRFGCSVMTRCCLFAAVQVAAVGGRWHVRGVSGYRSRRLADRRRSGSPP